MYLTYNEKLGVYLFVCSYHEKDIPKSLGFQWNPSKIQGVKSWFTTDITTAMKAMKYADNKVERIIESEIAKREKSIEQSHANSTFKAFKSPEGKNYYPFQSAGIEYMINHLNTLLSDEMGLGKSIQVVGLINNTDIKKVLIVCPNIVKLNWLYEIWKWLCKRLSISVIYAQKYEEADIMIINYDILSRYEKELSSIKWDLIVADESQYIKSAKTARYKVLSKILKNAHRKVFLTGTPILNRPIELWTTIQELCPKEFGTYWQFGKEFCGAKQVRIGYDRENEEVKYAWDFSGASNLSLLQSKLRSSCMIRRLKKDVLKELPDLTRQIIVLDDNKIAEEEKILFEEVKNDYQVQVESLKVNSLGFFEILFRIRHETALKKVPKVIEFVENILENEEKVVLFGHHKDVLSQFKEKWPDSVIITGDIPIDKRQKAIEKFQNDSKVRLFIGSIQASGVGITLTASSTVVFAELDWVPANISQAEARLMRIGQKNAVNSYHLVVNDTIDAHLAKTIVRKQEISDKALDKSVNLREIFKLGDIYDILS